MKKAITAVLVIATLTLSGCYWGGYGHGHHRHYMNESSTQG